MKIVRLHAENFKGLKNVDIKPTGSIVRITGKNAAGKTSAIDCIPCGLGGKGAIPSAPIRRGATKARIDIDLGEMVVQQSITAKGSYLKVTGPDGKAVKSPQTVLDEKVGDLSFDPLAFSRMDSKKQADVLRQLAGLDLDDLKRRERGLVEDRQLVTRESKALVARLESMAKPATDLPKEYLDTDAMHEATNKAASHNATIAKRRAYAESVALVYADAQAVLKRAEEHLKSAQTASMKADEVLSRSGQAVDMEALTTELSNAYEINKSIEAAGFYRILASEVSGKRESAGQLNRDIESVRTERAQRIADAKYPLKGLSVSEDGQVIYSGVPLDQTSQAESTLISASIAMALNPELRLMLIRDGSLLDSDSEKALETLAEDAEGGYQIWIEQVAERDENGNAPAGFFIENGELVEVDGETTQWTDNWWQRGME